MLRGRRREFWNHGKWELKIEKCLSHVSFPCKLQLKKKVTLGFNSLTTWLSLLNMDVPWDGREGGAHLPLWVLWPWPQQCPPGLRKCTLPSGNEPRTGPSGLPALIWLQLAGLPRSQGRNLKPRPHTRWQNVLWLKLELTFLTLGF